ncbi:Subtilisin-like protein [Mycena kentingensis (nom. inval.)]|nr:Subtilisin-like protein [Mycena kentingensis (nom. inval.)]
MVGGTKGIPEQAGPFSAGGFSVYTRQPSWQSTAVNAYLSRIGTLYAGRFNPGGARPTLVGGTSASAPIFAALIALLNAELRRAGKPVLGYLNPWLYAPANAGMWTDVMVGSNPGGFEAMSGWDAVSGLGTPIYSRMRVAARLR